MGLIFCPLECWDPKKDPGSWFATRAVASKLHYRCGESVDTICVPSSMVESQLGTELYHVTICINM